MVRVSRSRPFASVPNRKWMRLTGTSTTSFRPSSETLHHFGGSEQVGAFEIGEQAARRWAACPTRFMRIAIVADLEIFGLGADARADAFDGRLDLFGRWGRRTGSQAPAHSRDRRDRTDARSRMVRRCTRGRRMPSTTMLMSAALLRTRRTRASAQRERPTMGPVMSSVGMTAPSAMAHLNRNECADR